MYYADHCKTLTNRPNTVAVVVRRSQPYECPIVVRDNTSNMMELQYELLGPGINYSRFLTTQLPCRCELERFRKLSVRLRIITEHH